MTNEDIIRIAKEAGLEHRENINEIHSSFCDGVHMDELKLFAGLVIANHQPRSTMTWQEGYEVGVAAEREAIEQKVHKADMTANTKMYVINHLIRARGQE